MDVTMGAYDEAEVSELVGLYVLSKLTSIIDPSHLGDDGLAAVNKSNPQIERFRKNIFQIFKSMDLQVTIVVNITTTEFLDVWFDLEQRIYIYIYTYRSKPS